MTDVHFLVQPHRRFPEPCGKWCPNITYRRHRRSSTLVMSDVRDRQRALREDGGPGAVVRHHQSEERTDGGALCNGDLH